MKVARQWGDEIPIGIIYRNERPSFDEQFPVLDQGPLVGRDVDQETLKIILEGYV
jgi:2-oxoglutarate ferredoxin oxidoreductase subunit beta